MAILDQLLSGIKMRPQLRNMKRWRYVHFFFFKAYVCCCWMKLLVMIQSISNLSLTLAQVLNGTLSLATVTRETSGMYKCHVSNSEGNLTHTTQLQVKGQSDYLLTIWERQAGPLRTSHKPNQLSSLTLRVSNVLTPKGSYISP